MARDDGQNGQCFRCKSTSFTRGDGRAGRQAAAGAERRVERGQDLRTFGSSACDGDGGLGRIQRFPIPDADQRKVNPLAVQHQLGSRRLRTVGKQVQPSVARKVESV